jgi:hypothetical protein
MREPPKSWPKSKTIWFNVVMMLMEIMAMSDQFPEFIPQSFLAPIAIAQGVGNIILRRFFSVAPLKAIKVPPSSERHRNRLP